MQMNFSGLRALVTGAGKGRLEPRRGGLGRGQTQSLTNLFWDRVPLCLPRPATVPPFHPPCQPVEAPLGQDASLSLVSENPQRMLLDSV